MIHENCGIFKQIQTNIVPNYNKPRTNPIPQKKNIMPANKKCNLNVTKKNDPLMNLNKLNRYNSATRIKKTMSKDRKHSTIEYITSKVNSGIKRTPTKSPIRNRTPDFDKKSPRTRTPDRVNRRIGLGLDKDLIGYERKTPLRTRNNSGVNTTYTNGNKHTRANTNVGSNNSTITHSNTSKTRRSGKVSTRGSTGNTPGKYACTERKFKQPYYNTINTNLNTNYHYGSKTSSTGKKNYEYSTTTFDNHKTSKGIGNKTLTGGFDNKVDNTHHNYNYTAKLNNYNDEEVFQSFGVMKQNISNVSKGQRQPQGQVKKGQTQKYRPGSGATSYTTAKVYGNQPSSTYTNYGNSKGSSNNNGGNNINTNNNYELPEENKIEFNELDQFSPPYLGQQINLNYKEQKVPDTQYTNNIELRKNIHNTLNAYPMNTNRQLIDDFVSKMESTKKYSTIEYNKKIDFNKMKPLNPTWYNPTNNKYKK